MDDLFKPADVTTTDVQDPLDLLVGEGKKFKTNAELAKAKLESDRFIEQLQNEAAELRKEVSGKQTIDEIMTQIKSLSTPPAVPNAQQPQAPATPDTDSIADLVAKLLEQKESERKSQTNEQLVSNTLKEKFGADTQLHLTKKAQELGVSLDYLKSVAKSAPSAFFRLIGIDESRPQTITPSAIRSPNQPQIQPDPNVRNKAYYDRLKMVSPTEYFSPKIQNQMYKDAMKLQESFYN